MRKSYLWKFEVDVLSQNYYIESQFVFHNFYNNDLLIMMTFTHNSLPDYDIEKKKCAKVFNIFAKIFFLLKVLHDL